MLNNNHQTRMWGGKFGQEYTYRNALSLDELDGLYKKNFGLTRTALNEIFLSGQGKNIKILEVGSNIGNQLQLLRVMGFKNLYGIDINKCAIDFCKSMTRDLGIIQASAYNIPFKDECFDLVFTSGLLIHIDPTHIRSVLKEIYRCSKEYIWGYEYYAEEYTELTYRDQRELLWKADFPKLYHDIFYDLELVRKKRLKYMDNEDKDIMFLLKKATR